MITVFLTVMLIFAHSVEKETITMVEVFKTRNSPPLHRMWSDLLAIIYFDQIVAHFVKPACAE
jgi:hypothetical protein